MHWALWRVNITTSELLLQAQLSRQSKEVEEQRRRLPTPQYPGLKWFWNASNIFKHLKKAILRILWYTLMTQSFYIIRSLLKLPGRGNMALAKAKPLPWPSPTLWRTCRIARHTQRDPRRSCEVEHKIEHPQVGWCLHDFAWVVWWPNVWRWAQIVPPFHRTWSNPPQEDTPKQGCAFIAVKDFSTINELVSAKIYIRQSVLGIEDALHFNNQFSPILLRKRIRQSWLLSVNGCRQRGWTTEDWVSWMESILSRSERVTHHCWLWSILRP